MTSPEPPVFTGLFPINGATRLYGTIGDPIRQLRMTGIMPQVFAAVGANAVWLPFEGGPDLLPLMLEALARMRNLGGFTVTIPHKRGNPAAARPATRRAEASGSVNLVQRDPDGTLVGDIVDGLGFVRGLVAQGHRVRGASVWLVGLGGAGGAIAAALCEAGVGRLLVSEIDEQRAENSDRPPAAATIPTCRWRRWTRRPTASTSPSTPRRSGCGPTIRCRSIR